MNNKYSDILTVNTYILNHKENFIKDIGEVLKQERVNRNITLEEMEALINDLRKCKKSTSYISQIEKGGYGLSLIKFITICNALEVNENILEKFLFAGKKNEDFLYYKLQDGKNISQNILDYMKDKNNLVF